MAWRPLTSPLLLGLGFALCCCGAFGQTMYRCGSTYQDQPCATAQPGKVIGAARAAGGDSAAASSSRCLQRGIDAEKIAWAREGGKTMQQELNTGSYDQGLTQDVYLRRGTAAEIRSAIQHECDAQEARASAAPPAAAPAAAVTPAAGPGVAPHSAPAADTGAAERFQAEEQARAHDQAVRDTERAAESQQSRCAVLAAQAYTVAEQLRRANDRGTMNSLTQQASSIQSQQRLTGC